MVNHQDNMGLTPLMFAVNKGNRDVVETLLDNGADVYIRDKNGKTALASAATYADGDVVQLLDKACM